MTDTTLANDLLPSIGDIATFIYGVDNEAHRRKVRHLIARGEIPTRRIGGRITSRKSWILETPSFRSEVA